MTEMLNKEFSRKSFLKGGGAMIVGFSRSPARLTAATGNTPFASRSPQRLPPNLNTIDAWIAIRADNTVMVTHGETEFGHGTPTGILMLVAEELDVDMAQMIYALAETWLNAPAAAAAPAASRSRSTQTRAAAAYAKQELLKMASTNLGVPVASLSVSKGVVSGGGKSVTYGALIGGKNFNFTFPASQTSATPGQGIAKPVANYKLVGTVVSPHRHPRQGERSLHLRAERPDSRDVHAAGHPPARHRRQHVAEPLPDSVDESVDQEHPGRSGRPDRQLPRRRRRRRSTRRSRRRRS